LLSRVLVMAAVESRGNEKEVRARKLSGGKGQLEREAHNLTAICELFVEFRLLECYAVWLL
jgi:hypothetical protein